MNFLFWNINRNNLLKSVSNLVKCYAVDVLMLVECEINPGALLSVLNTDEKSEFYFSPNTEPSCNVRIFTKFPGSFLPPIVEDGRTTIRHFTQPNRQKFLLAVTHLPDKSHSPSVGDEFGNSANLVNLIQHAESLAKHKNTILVGDLNMNPFDKGIINGATINGVSSKSVALENSRRIQKKEYHFFYNPMWNLFGDNTPGPPGTYYYRAQYESYYWHMYDQVLIRPGLAERFDNSNLRILDFDGENCLITQKGLPNKHTYSDHLPIMFSINLRE